MTSNPPRSRSTFSSYVAPAQLPRRSTSALAGAATRTVAPAVAVASSAVVAMRDFFMVVLLGVVDQELTVAVQGSPSAGVNVTV